MNFRAFVRKVLHWVYLASIPLSLSSLAGEFSNDVSNCQASHRFYFAGVGDSIMVGHGGANCGGPYETALGGGPSGNTNMNILNKKAVLEAQKDPSSHPDLVVRVTGFSAYFASLSPEMRQIVVDRIIAEE